MKVRNLLKCLRYVEDAHPEFETLKESQGVPSCNPTTAKNGVPGPVLPPTWGSQP